MEKAEFIDTTSKAEDVVQRFSKGMHFIEELLRENERLRYKLIHLNQKMANLSDDKNSPVMEMEDELLRLRALREMIQNQFINMEKENTEFRTRFSELEKQNETFMNLFVSSCQLHSTLDEESILLSIQEIVLHMVGAEVFSIWMVNQTTGDFEIIAATDEGDYFKGKFPAIDENTISKLAAGQASYFSYDGKQPEEIGEALACIPLIMEGRTIGAIIIYKLLVQKSGFTSLDHEILDLLTNQAVTCLVGARLYSRSGSEPLYLEPLKNREKP
jgi:hypothetical protein